MGLKLTLALKDWPEVGHLITIESRAGFPEPFSKGKFHKLYMGRKKELHQIKYSSPWLIPRKLQIKEVSPQRPHTGHHQNGCKECKRRPGRKGNLLCLLWQALRARVLFCGPSYHAGPLAGEGRNPETTNVGQCPPVLRKPERTRGLPTIPW